MACPAQGWPPGWVVCSVHPLEHRNFQGLTRSRGIFREEEKTTVTVVKKLRFHTCEVTGTENGKSFLSSGEDFAFEGHRLQP